MLQDVRTTHRRSATHTAGEPLLPGQAPANAALDLLLIEDDGDCADALEALLSSAPGVGSVTVATTPRAALLALDSGTVRPAAIFVATQAEQRALAASLAALRQRAPQAVIVLLCVYPERMLCCDIASQADICISKDTGRHELARLIDGLQQFDGVAD